MRPRSFRCVPAHVIVIALISSTGAVPAAQDAAAAPRAQPRLVRLADPVARSATVSALNTAVARLEDAGCRKILLDFADRAGRSLEDRLTSLRVDVDQYVGSLVFYDGTRTRPCDKGVMAFTAPDSRVVYVCINQFKQMQSTQPDYVVAVLIHEILHTLGLGEDPPSSREITRRVLARCGPR